MRRVGYAATVARVCTVAVLCAAALAGAPARAVDTPDPARVDGGWYYRTESNCGSVVGVGKLWFAWNRDDGRYDEGGFVHWSDSGSTITWWGHAAYEAGGHRLRASVDNSLGDHVDGTWRLEGRPPTRLVVTWSQTNGCRGTGVATRAP